MAANSPEKPVKKNIRRVVIDGGSSTSSQKSQKSSGPPPSSAPGGGRRRRGGRGGKKSFEEQAKEAARKSEARKRESRGKQGVIDVPLGATPKEVGEYTEKPTTEVIKKLMLMGEMVTVNQSLSEDTLLLLADELGLEFNLISLADELASQVDSVSRDDLQGTQPRPPVVTIMGHVDHGKTSLLDAIRETEVQAKEAGGITQHIGAYQVHRGDQAITFIDTPGHEAFTAMRARGAVVTDIVVLVVAADDSVQPQTEEAISHAQAVGVPIIVAVNKIDKDGADPERVRSELAGRGISPEEWGGDNLFVDISAKKRIGIDDILEAILLVAEVEELTGDPDAEEAHGVVIESRLDIGRGPVATVIVQRGTLCVGDVMLSGVHFGKVKSMHSDQGETMHSAGPGTPVEILGFQGVPEAGERVRSLSDEREARRIADERASRLHAEALSRRHKRVTLSNFAQIAAQQEVKTLPVLIKCDTRGSVEAIEDELIKLPQGEVQVDTVHSGVGGVNESDVMLASASGAIIIAFNVRAVGNAELVAQREGVEVRYYSVIYRISEEIRQAMEGLLGSEEVETILGRAEVLEIFRASKVGQIAGSQVKEGQISRGDAARIIRQGTVVYTGKINSLRRAKDDVQSVDTGVECGITLENYQDVKQGDIIETFQAEWVDRKLA